jgi:hypothetical protein
MRYFAIAVGALLALTTSEVLLRIWLPSPNTPLSDAVLDVRARPGGEYDSRGFRNLKAVDQADIVAIGDSQTFGYKALRIESWPAQLETISGKAVYQLAHVGWGPAQYRALLPTALSLKPKTVVVGLYAGNDLLGSVDQVYRLAYWTPYRDSSFVYSTDITDTLIDTSIALDDGYAPGSFWNKFTRFRQIARGYSRIFEILDADFAYAWWQSPLGETPEERKNRFDTLLQSHPGLGIRLEGITGTILSPSYRYPAVDLTNATTKEGWRLTKSFLREMHDGTKEAGAQLLIVFIPTKEMVYLESARMASTTIPGFEEYEWAERNLSSAVTDFCITEKIDCVFPLRDMAIELNKSIPLYERINNGHPIVGGYRIIAETIARHL